MRSAIKVKFFIFIALLSLTISFSTYASNESILTLENLSIACTAFNPTSNEKLKCLKSTSERIDNLKISLIKKLQEKDQIFLKNKLIDISKNESVFCSQKSDEIANYMCLNHLNTLTVKYIMVKYHE